MSPVKGKQIKRSHYYLFFFFYNNLNTSLKQKDVHHSSILKNLQNENIIFVVPE